MDPGGTDASVVIPDGISHGYEHKFRINYSKIKNMKNGEHIVTPRFRSGGSEWVLLCYPQGSEKEDDGFVSLYLRLLSDPKEVSVSFDFGIFVLDRGQMFSKGAEVIFSTGSMTHGIPRFLRKNEFENMCGIHGWFVIACTIVLPATCEQMSCECFLSKDISKLIETNEMADVKFSVGGEIFEAHKAILGARSAVFKAELFGSMAEKEMEVIPIKEMKAAIFKELLRFIYTDSLPDAASSDMIQSLMVAADRYAIEGLVANCQEKLLTNLSLDTVVGFMIFADCYGFSKIKERCLELMSEQNNLSQLELTEGYIQMASNYPSLFEEVMAANRQEKLLTNLSVDTVVGFLIFADSSGFSKIKERCLEFMCQRDNFSQLAITKGYIQMAFNYPSLLEEVRRKVSQSK